MKRAPGKVKRKDHDELALRVQLALETRMDDLLRSYDEEDQPGVAREWKRASRALEEAFRRGDFVAATGIEIDAWGNDALTRELAADVSRKKDL